MTSRWDEAGASAVRSKAETGVPDLGSAWTHSTMNDLVLVPGGIYSEGDAPFPGRAALDTVVRIGEQTSSSPIEVQTPVFLTQLPGVFPSTMAEIAQKSSSFAILDSQIDVEDTNVDRTVARWKPDRSGISLSLLRRSAGAAIVTFEPRALLDSGAPLQFIGLQEDMDLMRSIDLLKEAMGQESPVLVEIPGRRPEDELIDAINAGADGAVITDRGCDLLGGGRPTLHSLMAAKMIKDKVGEIETRILLVGDLGSSLDVVRALALGADAVSMTKAPLQAAGMLSSDGRLLEDVQADALVQRVSNFINATTQEIREILVHMGRSSLSELSEADLRAADYDTAAITGLPICGHNKKLAMWMH